MHTLISDVSTQIAMPSHQLPLKRGTILYTPSLFYTYGHEEQPYPLLTPHTP
ncbi:MAG: hypothetical protein ACTSO9_04885 [Candidatus Helarchaeota archaeon]